MSYLPPELSPYVKYLGPPIVGAFIGYLTNRIAIRMLFRPLKKWKIAGLPVPMTPGVIPAKRGDLAINMGQVVGDHLLTSKEIGRGLQQEPFQNHLYSLIHERVEKIFQKDLGTLASTIPEKFRVYFAIGSKTIFFQLKEHIHNAIRSDDFAQVVEQYLDRRLDHLLEQPVQAIVDQSSRESSYQFIEQSIDRLLASEAMERWVEDLVHQQVYDILRQEKSLADLLDPSLQETILASMEKQVPGFLKKLTEIISEPEVREKVIAGARGGVEKFINSLGSMADMVRNFLPLETVEEKIRDYLDEKNEAIATWLQSEEMKNRVTAILLERGQRFLTTPLVSIFRAKHEDRIEAFCRQCSKQLLLLLRGREVQATLCSMIKTNLEDHLQAGEVTLGESLFSIFGEHSIATGKSWVKQATVRFLREPETIRALDSVVDSLIESLLQKKIGKLANFVPVTIRDDWARSLQAMASQMLEIEVPGLVESLNIRQIVTEKVNSLDILKLEGLLLSIMEEQFKYINLFGALLGFLIGCLNIILLYGI